jgi:hypothetical protein
VSTRYAHDTSTTINPTSSHSHQHHTRVMGVIQCVNRLQQDDWDRADAILLRGVASQASILLATALTQVHTYLTCNEASQELGCCCCSALSPEWLVLRILLMQAEVSQASHNLSLLLSFVGALADHSSLGPLAAVPLSHWLAGPPPPGHQAGAQAGVKHMALGGGGGGGPQAAPPLPDWSSVAEGALAVLVPAQEAGVMWYDPHQQGLVTWDPEVVGGRVARMQTCEQMGASTRFLHLCQRV